MKHSLKITFLMVFAFILSQFIGLGIIAQYIDIKETAETGRTVVNQEAFGITGIEPPALEPEQEKISWVFITIAVLIGTGLVLLIIKLKGFLVWKFWFMMSVVITLYIALAQFVNKFMGYLGILGSKVLFSIGSFPLSLAGLVTLLIVGCLAYYKIFRKNIYIHNITEVFVYGGLAALLVPHVAVSAAVILLIVISVYDMIAVWKTKHMVTMAKFQTENKLFAGLMVPYKVTAGDQEPKGNPGKLENVKTAVLGGGDVAFPLIFAGAVMKTTASIFNPVIIILFSALALFGLLVYGKKDHFYPAMPFISAGCFLGYGIVYLLGIL